MRLDVVSIFPDYLAPLDLSLIGKARRDGLLDLQVHNLRDFTNDRHRTVDDTPFGGGAGMVMKPEPWARALDHVVNAGSAAGSGERPRLIVPGPGGIPFSQRMAHELAAEPWLAFACGRYEGLDERIYEHAAQRMPVTVLSLGDYVLNGGEVAVLAIVEAVARLLPGVVGNAESLVEESHEDGLLEYPVYTKPATWQDGEVTREVPPILLSGDHGAIARWRHEQRLIRTAARRPDLLPATATVEGLADVEVRLASPADAAELYVLQLAAFVSEGRLHDEWIPPLTESPSEVAEAIGSWLTYVVRMPPVGPSPGRLLGSVRGRLRPGDDSVWEIARLMVVPDLRGRGLGRELLALIERSAPASARSYWLETGVGSEHNLRVYKKAGYRPAGPGVHERTVSLIKTRR